MVSGCRAGMDSAERMDASSQRTQQKIARPAMAARGNRPGRRRIEPSGLHFLLSIVAGLPFAELFPRPYRLRLPCADEHDCHKTALDKNAWPRRKGNLSLVSSGDTAEIVQIQFAEYGQPEPG